MSYLAVGLVITLVRAWFYHQVSLLNPPLEFGASPEDSGYQCVNMVMVPASPMRFMRFEILVRLNLIEASFRALGCAVGIPYLLLSRRAKQTFANVAKSALLADTSTQQDGQGR